jgi:hypothetical protein
VSHRRYRSQPVVSSLIVLLTSNFLSDRPPPRLPGEDRRSGKFFCPKHKTTELKYLRKGKLYCPKCPGQVFDAPREN